MPEPTTIETVRSVVIWDADTDELVSTRVYRVLVDGRERTLRLRVARGILRDTDEGDR